MTDRIPLVPVLALLVGCGGGGGAGTEDGTPPVDPNAPTYYEDVAPILADHCVGCHVDGGIAPFPLTTYDEVTAEGQRVAIATASREMPPGRADASGACGEFHEPLWLEDEQIETIGAWVDAGMLAGDPANAPAIPEPDVLEDATVRVGMDVAYTPDENVDDDFRCFVLDPNLSIDQFLTGFQVNPGEPRVVHHVVITGLVTEEHQNTVEALDAADPGPGYDCLGGVGVEDGLLLAVWAPGTGPTRYPAGTGLRMLYGRKVVMQIHYNLQAGALPDRTTVDLALTPAVDNEAVMTGLGDFDFELSPGDADATGSESFPLNDLEIPVYVHAVWPHMHLAGKTLRVELERGADSTCMLDVPRWDFNWQLYYQYQEPLRVEPGDVLSIACSWDMSDRDEVTRFGEGTGDEMCLAALYVSW